MKQLNSESGITLIEVLATLTITAIIGSVVYAVFFQTQHTNEKTQSHNELRQEANIVMTQLRTMHENGESIWYSSDRLYTDQNQENLLVTEPYHFVEAQIKNLNNSNIMKLDKNSTKTIEYPLHSESTLEVFFRIADNYGNEYKLETVLPGKTNLSINIDVSRPGYSFPAKPPVTCKPAGYTFPNSPPYGTTCVAGDASIASSAKATVNGTLYIEGDLTLNNGNQGDEGNQGNQGNQGDEGNQGNQGDEGNNGNGITSLTVNKNGTEGDLIVTGTLDIQNHTQIDVTNGKAYFNNIIISQPNASININGDTYIFGTISGVNENNTQICIQGTLYSKQDLNGTVKVDANLSCPNNKEGIYARAYQKLN